MSRGLSRGFKKCGGRDPRDPRVGGTPALNGRGEATAVSMSRSGSPYLPHSYFMKRNRTLLYYAAGTPDIHTITSVCGWAQSGRYWCGSMCPGTGRGGGQRGACPSNFLTGGAPPPPPALDCRCRLFLFLFVFARELGCLPPKKKTVVEIRGVFSFG